MRKGKKRLVAANMSGVPMRTRVGRAGQNLRKKVNAGAYTIPQMTPAVMTNTVGNLQPQNQVMKIGFDAPGSGTIISPGTAWSPSTHIVQVPLVPGEPGTFPTLSATAVQFLHYNVQRFSVLWRPRSTTQTAGAVAFCVWPTNRAVSALPQSYAEFVSQSGCQTGLTWGQAQSFDFPSSSFNSMFKNLITDMLDDPNGGNTQTDRTCGVLAFTTEGIAADTEVGEYGLNYGFKFWGQRPVATGTMLTGKYYKVSPTAIMPVAAHLYSGRHTFVNSNFPNVLELRNSRTSHLLVVSVSATFEVSPNVVLEIGLTPGTMAVHGPDQQYAPDANTIVAVFKLTPSLGRFVKLYCTGNNTYNAYSVNCTSSA